jgi:AcrR family transcriptional regulator
MKTRDRILQAAVGLFNESGTAAVSTNHIADALGISPGNLYYHFRNKEEIIRAVFEQLFDLWDRLYALPADRAPTLEDALRLVRTNFTVMWDYRFAYRELIALLRRDHELRERYMAVRQRGYQGFRELMAAFVAAGVLTVPDDETVTRLADLCWLLSEFWLASVEVTGETVDDAAMRRGVELMVQVIRPYAAGEAALLFPGGSHE